jgi:sortase A
VASTHDTPGGTDPDAIGDGASKKPETQVPNTANAPRSSKSEKPASVSDHDSWVKLWSQKSMSHKEAKKAAAEAGNIPLRSIDPSAQSTPPERKPAPESKKSSRKTKNPDFRRVAGSGKLNTALGVFGELLITGGVVVLLFLTWQLWINNAIVASEQADAVKNFSNNITSSPSASSQWTPKARAIDYGPPPVFSAVGQDDVMGNLYVPRLGSGSTRAVANGVTNPGATINRGYYGKYEGSAWPGEPGNFAMAVHRTGWGTSFTQAQTIRPGDHIYLETSQGWYVYTVRNTEYVVPTQVDVTNPMPLSQAPAIEGQSILTITTCSPMDGNGERLVIYGFLSSWQPIDAGIPTEITKLVEEARS